MFVLIFALNNLEFSFGYALPLDRKIYTISVYGSAQANVPVQPE